MAEDFKIKENIQEENGKFRRFESQNGLDTNFMYHFWEWFDTIEEAMNDYIESHPWRTIKLS